MIRQSLMLWRDDTILRLRLTLLAASMGYMRLLLLQHAIIPLAPHNRLLFALHTSPRPRRCYLSVLDSVLGVKGIAAQSAVCFMYVLPPRLCRLPADIALANAVRKLMVGNGNAFILCGSCALRLCLMFLSYDALFPHH